MCIMCFCWSKMVSEDNAQDGSSKELIISIKDIDMREFLNYGTDNDLEDSIVEDGLEKPAPLQGNNEEVQQKSIILVRYLSMTRKLIRLTTQYCLTKGSGVCTTGLQFLDQIRELNTGATHITKELRDHDEAIRTVGVTLRRYMA